MSVTFPSCSAAGFKNNELKTLTLKSSVQFNTGLPEHRVCRQNKLHFSLLHWRVNSRETGDLFGVFTYYNQWFGAAVQSKRIIELGWKEP